jgi:hypothetical protein
VVSVFAVSVFVDVVSVWAAGGGWVDVVVAVSVAGGGCWAVVVGCSGAVTGSGWV